MPAPGPWFGAEEGAGLISLDAAAGFRLNALGSVEREGAAVAAGRLWAVLAVVAVTGCAGETDVAPYIWPTPPDNVPWTGTSFELRYSDWRNTPDDLRQTVAQWCGPRFNTARIYPHPYTGTALHPHSATVVCGSPPPPRPEFRGQAVDESYLMPLAPPAGR